MKFCRFALLSLTVLSFALYCDGALSCLDEKGNPVDYIIGYKLPKVSSTKFPADNADYYSTGKALLYQLPKTKGNWTRATKNIDQDGNFMKRTLDIIYQPDPQEKTGWLLYSDQPPASKDATSTYAHAKGVLIFDAQGAVHLIHSIPNFPASPTVNGSYIFTPTGTVYGQAILCLTLGSFDDAENIAKQLYNAKIWVADKSEIPNYVTDDHTPYLYALFQPKPYTGDSVPSDFSTVPRLSMLNFKTTNGQAFVSFCKNPKFNDDMYSSPNGIVQKLSASVRCETWRKGPGNLPDDCESKYATYNLNELEFKDLGIGFTTTQDHSKWCASVTGDKMFMISDMNRQNGQLRRGGCAVLIKDAAICKSYVDIMKGVDDCPV